MTAIRDDVLKRAVAVFEGEGATAVHLFGSLARGDGDALSDIDLWITVPDDEIEDLVACRFEIFSGIADILIHHEAPRNRPLGGSYTLVIHRSGDALHQCDYYLAPELTSVVLPEARHLYGSRTLPHGRWVLDSAAVVHETVAERIDFLICMSFIGIKKSLRGDGDFLEFLDREYEKFRVTNGAVLDASSRSDDLESLADKLKSLFVMADERQSAAIRTVLDTIPRQARLHAEPIDTRSIG